MNKIFLCWVIVFSVSGCKLLQAESALNVYYGLASWYSEEDPGVLDTTANMEEFDDEKLTCAIWDIPFNTLVKVTNVLNGKTVIVRVNDRGPAKRLVKEGRVVDLTKAAFEKIGDLKKGLLAIKMEILPQLTKLSE